MNIQSNIPATALRQQMIEDMVARNLGPHSQRNHLASCERFAAFLGRSTDARAWRSAMRRFADLQMPLAELTLCAMKRHSNQSRLAPTEI